MMVCDLQKGCLGKYELMHPSITASTIVAWVMPTPRLRHERYFQVVMVLRGVGPFIGESWRASPVRAGVPVVDHFQGATGRLFVHKHFRRAAARFFGG